ncbi:MAG: hypothetical protein EA001_01520 [Oscillatoriales cyanobacterium]|nr:MAG: hypothetical protein EA001_01520 [Oscillatoriales cyanobacterium]
MVSPQSVLMIAIGLIMAMGDRSRPSDRRVYGKMKGGLLSQRARLGRVVIAWAQAETADFPCPNGRNKGLKPLAAYDFVAVESGFHAI